MSVSRRCQQCQREASHYEWCPGPVSPMKPKRINWKRVWEKLDERVWEDNPYNKTVVDWHKKFIRLAVNAELRRKKCEQK